MLRILYLILTLTMVAGCHRPEPPGQVTLTINGAPLKAEIAASPARRAMGLMERMHLDADRGMLFVFPSRQPVAFWMQNTPLPLSIAFIDENGMIVGTAEMMPLTNHLHRSEYPVKYALEMNARWFERHRIKAGMRVEGLEGIEAPS